MLRDQYQSTCLAAKGCPTDLPQKYRWRAYDHHREYCCIPDTLSQLNVGERSRRKFNGGALHSIQTDWPGIRSDKGRSGAPNALSSKVTRTQGQVRPIAC